MTTAGLLMPTLDLILSPWFSFRHHLMYNFYTSVHCWVICWDICATVELFVQTVSDHSPKRFRALFSTSGTSRQYMSILLTTLCEKPSVNMSNIAYNYKFRGDRTVECIVDYSWSTNCVVIVLQNIGVPYSILFYIFAIAIQGGREEHTC